MKLIISVGTTKFDKLIKKLDEPEIIKALKHLKVKKISLQLGQ